MSVQAVTVVRPSPRVVYRTVGQDGVLLHLDTAAYHSLNEMGALIWRTIQDGVSFGTLVQEVERCLEDPPQQLARDVAEFLGELEKQGLVILCS